MNERRQKIIKKLKELKKDLIMKDIIHEYEMVFVDYPVIISTPQEFTDALIHCCKEEHKDLVVLKESMAPIVKIDGKVYIARIDRKFGKLYGGLDITTPFPIPYFGGPKSPQCIYVYPYEYTEN